MNAYDVMQLSTLYGITIGNFNIMSHKASRFSKPNKDGSIRGGETREEWLKRYGRILDVIEELQIDILALEEVSLEFFSMLKTVHNYHIIYEPHPNNLAIILKKRIIRQYESLQIKFEHKYSKVQGLSLTLLNGRHLNIYNVQLIGNPVSFRERRDVLRNIKDADIIIGDFNEDKHTLELFVEPVMPEYIIDHIEGVATSYSRFLADKGKVVEIKEHPWENVDNIIYKKTLRLGYKQITPPGGIYGKQVPYHMTTPFEFEENYTPPTGWPSDHSLQIYTFFL